MTYSTTIAERSTTRQNILNTEDKRVLVPFDYNLITPIIRPLYADIWPTILADKIACPIEVEYTEDNHDAFIAFLRGWILANGHNRDNNNAPGEHHIAELIAWMRDGFSPESTNFAVSTEGAVTNGGHSGPAILRGFFPQEAFYGLRGAPYMAGDVHVKWEDAEEEEEYFYFKGTDGLCYMSILPPMPTDTVVVDGVEVAKYPELGEFDEDDRYIPGTDSPEIRKYYTCPHTGQKKPQVLRITIHVFGVPSALHRENTTLVPTAETYLSMSGNIKTHYAENVPKWLKGKMGNLLTMLRKRTMHSSTGFGTVGRGGRMNGEDAPSWYLAYMPQIMDSIALLSDTQGAQTPRPLFSPAKGDADNPAYKGGANILQILVAMAVSDQAGRQRIAEWVTSTGDALKKNAGLKKLVDLVRPPKSSTTGSLPTDAIVELLVLIGLGKTDPVAVFEEDYTRAKGDEVEEISPWLVEELRAAGWDRSDVDTLGDGDDTLSTSLVEYAKQLSGEKSRAAKSATRKAPKGKPSKGK